MLLMRQLPHHQQVSVYFLLQMFLIPQDSMILIPPGLLEIVLQKKERVVCLQNHPCQNFKLQIPCGVAALRRALQVSAQGNRNTGN